MTITLVILFVIVLGVLFDFEPYFHCGRALLSVCMSVYVGLAYCVGFACSETARILSDIASVFLRVHLCKDCGTAVIAACVACSSEPVAEACCAGC